MYSETCRKITSLDINLFKDWLLLKTITFPFDCNLRILNELEDLHNNQITNARCKYISRFEESWKREWKLVQKSMTMLDR